MGLPTKTLDEISRRAVALFRTSFDGLPMGTKRFLGRTARGVGLIVWGLHKSLEDIDNDIVISSKSSTDTLSGWAANIGLSDGQGGYGRALATTASGGEATITGALGTSFSDGDTATSEDGVTQIALSGAVSIPGSGAGFGSVAAVFISVTTGSDGNSAIGTVFSWDNPPAGADSTFTLTAALAGGVDEEDNPTLFARIITRLQTPPRGGAAEDYREWANEVAGLGDVYVYEKRSGTGTIDLVITTSGSGQSRIPSATMLADVSTAVETERPRGAETVNVLAPSMPDDNGHIGRVRVVPSSSDYNFDWVDTAASYTVDTYAAGPPATLKLNTLAPTSLKAAIDAYIAGTGDAPRLQVLSTGSVINASIRCVNYSDGGGKTTLTLETVTAAWTAPTAGDTVYAYGPVVATIAAGLVAFADSLGPSLVSGYGDQLTPWRDTLTISGMIAVAESAIDTDGTELIDKVPVGGCTIDGLVLDVQGGDATDDSPELLYFEQVAVTQ